MSGEVPSQLHMWAVFVLIGVVIIAYVWERITLELTATLAVGALLLLFTLAPLRDADGHLVMDSAQLLAGFANPALIAVMALLVIGQAMVQTGALDWLVRRVVILRRHHPTIAITLILACALAISAFINNTPVVVIFIPIMTALAERLGWSVSSVMIPLSFACILGGMTTLIGSSTNLLVAGTAGALGEIQIDFFDLSIPGLILAAVGFAYLMLFARRLLPDRRSMAGHLAQEEGKQFIAQLAIRRNSPLVGQTSVGGMFPALSEITVRMVQRGEVAFLPPFDDLELRSGDELVVAATRRTLTETLSSDPGLLDDAMPMPESPETSRDGLRAAGDQELAEVVVAPASRIAGRTLRQIVFHHRTHCIVLGLQRRSRMFRTALHDIRLESGDVLLVLGHQRDIRQLRGNPDVILLEWSARSLPAVVRARPALAIFAAVVLASASGLIPIVAAAVAGAGTMVLTGCLNVHQARRSLDFRILLVAGSALAMSAAMQATGGAAFLANGLVGTFAALPPALLLSAFFLLIAVMTNLLSNNATAVLFTPIAINLAGQLGLDPVPFVFTVIFAANCSFATPVGYQTNLLVMGPGHYRFADFLRVGGPLVLILWLTYSIFAPWYFGL